MVEHRWDVYQQRCSAFHVQWLRSLTPADAIRLYQGLHRLSRAQADDSPGWQRLRQKHWEEKLALRRKLHAAFARLDAIHGR
jgi:hypothetical protein